MNVLMVGNGFDLHHMYPTGYINFLHTLQYLTENCNEGIDSVGKVLGNDTLQTSDDFIQKCYAKHSRIYDCTPLDPEDTKRITDKARDNLWFNYLCSCVNKDIRWIDFEKEISRVMEAFTTFFEYDDEIFLMDQYIVYDPSAFPSDIEDRHILKFFNFFYEDFKESMFGGTELANIKKQYTLEKVVGSKSYYIDSDAITSELYKSLRELAEILQWYLLCFVDAPSKEYTTLGFKPQWASYPSPHRVYSFNYTNTLEILYGNNMVDHIHGNTCDQIVLGVNPDENDSMNNVDTTFLQFKKYFQRIFFRTDLSYIRNINVIKATPRSNDTHLVVMGHSLDITDKDIIMEIFDTARKITILYHNDSSVKKQIRNLVEIYGKEGLDKLRSDRNLQFIPQAEIEWIS